MNSAERQLRWFLNLSAAILLLALAAVLMPYAAMNEIHRWFGLGDLPDTPMVSYLARSASALYASFGLLYAYMARDVKTYIPLLKVMAAIKFFFGLGMLGLDVDLRMPHLWTWVEGPFILCWSSMLWWLANRVRS